ncbi:exodeoxyribonuclease VII large subunit [Algoriphagus marinus]|uniref:exodeoxyribonuclease VII large subunit n=1 Tax=Algoriphagus marinus TaxID=1925762 RepID=UPI00094BAB79|nr:exodeoxyribonuclease VII large subunit [Algoriphagus marinus]
MTPKSIVELNQLIQATLENELDPVYWVVGEIADFRQAPQGHAYFELVEKQGNQVLAKIKANLWQFTYRTVAARFESITGSGLKNGMKVLAQVAVNFHPLYGLSVNVKDIDPSFSLGERARIRQETIDRLTVEGLIRLNARHELPPVIQKIAIISSPTAAGYGDFINQIESNPDNYKIYHKLYPSMMQGNEAVTSLINSLKSIFADLDQLKPDAVVIIRGGGAQLDLDCFDDYRLAVAIARFPIPVLTGIGHERDQSIADLTAHTQLKTPTAVAEFLLASFREFEENLNLALTRLDRSTRLQLKNAENKLNQLSHQVKAMGDSRIKLESEKLKSKADRLISSSRNKIRIAENNLASLEKSILKGMLQFVRTQEQELQSKSITLNQLDPKSIFKRGYTRSEVEGLPVDLAKFKGGEKMLTYSEKLKIESTITKIESK